MIEHRYLELGVTGMARAHRASGLAGHLGAALVAGYAFGEELPDLPEAVFQGITAELDRVLRGEETVWYNVQKTGIPIKELFQPFPPKSSPGGLDVRPIADALAENIGKLHQSGHNVIFAALAIRALKDHPALATRERLDGLVKLIRGFNGSIPGMAYLGKDRGGWVRADRVELRDSMRVEPYEDVVAMVKRTIDEVIVSAGVRRQGVGGMWHLINHAAGLLDLSLYGFADLARRGLEAHRDHLWRWRSLPDVSEELGPFPRAKHDPRTAEFWQHAERLKRDDARLTHRIKTLYGFARLMTVETDPRRKKQAWGQLGYLMA